MNIVCAESILFAKEIFSHLGHLTVIPDALIDRQAVKKADILLVRSKTKITAELIKDTPIRFIGTATAGIDHLDISYFNKAGITWCNAIGSNANSVAEYVIAALLYLVKKHSFSLTGKTLGIIGKGQVGSRLENLAVGLGLRVLACDPPLALQRSSHSFVTLSELLNKADIISLHVPLNRSGPFATYRMVNAAFLNRVKQGGVLVNTSRGEVIDEESLYHFLQMGKLGPIILDVFDNEPSIKVALLKYLTLATPHIAGYSLEGRVQGSLQIYQKLCAYLKINPVISFEHLFIQQPTSFRINSVNGSSITEKLCEIVQIAYDIQADFQDLLGLQNLPDDCQSEYFKQLRNRYKARWEFHNFVVKVDSKECGLKSILTALGFLIEEN